MKHSRSELRRGHWGEKRRITTSGGVGTVRRTPYLQQYASIPSSRTGTPLTRHLFFPAAGGTDWRRRQFLRALCGDGLATKHAQASNRNTQNTTTTEKTRYKYSKYNNCLDIYVCIPPTFSSISRSNRSTASPSISRRGSLPLPPEDPGRPLGSSCCRSSADRRRVSSRTSSRARLLRPHSCTITCNGCFVRVVFVPKQLERMACMRTGGNEPPHIRDGIQWAQNGIPYIRYTMT